MPDNSGDFPVVGQYQCSGLELGSVLGYFDRTLCNQIQAATFETCGCEPIFFDPDLVDHQPTTNVTNEDACYVCGNPDAVMTNPDALLLLPNTTSIRCDELSAVAMMGKFPSSYCINEIQPRAKNDCGCLEPLPPIDGSLFHDGRLETPQSEPDVEESRESTGFVCDICGPDGKLVNHDTFVSLSNGVTTCAALDEAGKAGLFEETYCSDEIIPRTVEENCCSFEPAAVELPEVEGEEPEPEQEEEEKEKQPSSHLPISSSDRLESSKFERVKGLETLPETFAANKCYVCGPNATVDNGNELLSLPDGVTTCSAFEAAGLAGLFNQTFCTEEAMVLAETECGCIVTSSPSVSPGVGGGEPFLANQLSGRIDASSLSSTGHYTEYPDETNVGDDADGTSRIPTPFFAMLSSMVIATVVSAAFL
jgi:hypothetical protein